MEESSPGVETVTAEERELAANAYELLQTLSWSSTGDLIPARTVEGEVTIGEKTIRLYQPNASFRVFEVGLQMCVEVQAEVDGVTLVSSYTGYTGSSQGANPGKTCLEAHTNAVEVGIPTGNYPGLIGWDEILLEPGTCLDLIYLVFSKDDSFEVPRVVDCGGPHEYVLVETPILDLKESPSDEEIGAASDFLCAESVRVWARESGREPVSYVHWSPYDWAYQDGDRDITCLAQMADDVEQRVTYEDAYGS